VSKFTAIGVSVFMTALFSFISSIYAANMIFQNIILSIPIGLFFGGVIFSLDRFIIMSMKKTEKILIDIIIATPRILISLVIVIIIKIPLELSIFQQKIDAAISVSFLPNDFFTRLQVYEELQVSNINIKLIIPL